LPNKGKEKLEEGLRDGAQETELLGTESDPSLDQQIPKDGEDIIDGKGAKERAVGEVAERQAVDRGPDDVTVSIDETEFDLHETSRGKGELHDKIGYISLDGKRGSGQRYSIELLQIASVRVVKCVVTEDDEGLWEEENIRDCCCRLVIIIIVVVVVVIVVVVVVIVVVVVVVVVVVGLGVECTASGGGDRGIVAGIGNNLIFEPVRPIHIVAISRLVLPRQGTSDLAHEVFRLDIFVNFHRGAKHLHAILHRQDESEECGSLFAERRAATVGKNKLAHSVRERTVASRAMVRLGILIEDFCLELYILYAQILVLKRLVITAQVTLDFARRTDDSKVIYESGGQLCRFRTLVPFFVLSIGKLVPRRIRRLGGEDEGHGLVLCTDEEFPFLP